jgi:murein DD-endopeptidase MepM/ murein hydrolase activator NlpD
VPVFSSTLDEWRIHTGMDISTEEGANVVAVESGEVLAIYKHPMLGYTIEVKHSETHKSVYQNLDADSVSVKVGDKVAKGDVIASVGDTTVIELADEPHLHFELMVNGVSVNPLDYFTAESLKASLGIE